MDNQIQSGMLPKLKVISEVTTRAQCRAEGNENNRFRPCIGDMTTIKTFTRMLRKGGRNITLILFALRNLLIVDGNNSSTIHELQLHSTLQNVKFTGPRISIMRHTLPLAQWLPIVPCLSHRPLLPVFISSQLYDSKLAKRMSMALMAVATQWTWKWQIKLRSLHDLV